MLCWRYVAVAKEHPEEGRKGVNNRYSCWDTPLTCSTLVSSASLLTTAILSVAMWEMMSHKQALASRLGGTEMNWYAEEISSAWSVIMYKHSLDTFNWHNKQKLARKWASSSSLSVRCGGRMSTILLQSSSVKSAGVTALRFPFNKLNISFSFTWRVDQRVVNVCHSFPAGRFHYKASQNNLASQYLVSITHNVVALPPALTTSYQIRTIAMLEVRNHHKVIPFTNTASVVWWRMFVFLFALSPISCFLLPVVVMIAVADLPPPQWSVGAVLNITYLLLQLIAKVQSWFLVRWSFGCDGHGGV